MAPQNRFFCPTFVLPRLRNGHRIYKRSTKTDVYDTSRLMCVNLSTIRTCQARRIWWRNTQRYIENQVINRTSTLRRISSARKTYVLGLNKLNVHGSFSPAVLPLMGQPKMRRMRVPYLSLRLLMVLPNWRLKRFTWSGSEEPRTGVCLLSGLG